MIQTGSLEERIIKVEISTQVNRANVCGPSEGTSPGVERDFGEKGESASANRVCVKERVRTS